MRSRRVCATPGRGASLLAVLALAVVVAGPLVPGARAWADSAVSPPSVVDDMAITSDCSSDATKPMQAWLEQLPPDTTVDLGGGCYQVDHGLILRFVQGLTVQDGTFQDLNRTREVNKGHGTPRGEPVIDALGGSDITLSNLTFIGANPGGYHAHLAFQAAIELQGTIGATLSALTISKTFGDGIDLEPLRGGSDHESGGIVNPSENISIDHVVIRGAGRQGITLASVNGVAINDVTMSNIAMDAFDFEADQDGEGAKNVVINDCSFSQLLNISMQGNQTGPITVENCVMPEADQGWAVNIKNTKGQADAGPIVFDNDVFNCGASVYVACFDLDGATDLVVEHSTATIGYLHDQIHEHAYRAINNTHASFLDDNVSGYGILGGVSADSLVSLVGGRWAPKHIGPTTTSLSQSADAVAYGSENANTFVVTVTGGKSPAPTGTVTVADVGTESPICVAVLVPGPGNVSTGTCGTETAEFDGGTSFFTVAATYYGDGNYSDSQSSPPQTFTVGPAPTVVAISESTDAVAYGSENADNFVATVTEQDGDASPTGTVVMQDGATSTLICTATLVPSPGNSSTASCTPGQVEFPSGTTFTSITALYNGDGNDAGSISSMPLALSVASGSTATALSQSADTVADGSESTDTFDVTVTASEGDAAPSGTVSVSDETTGTFLCSASLATNPDNTSTGECTLMSSQFPTATAFTSIVGTYSGDGNNNPSVSSPPQTFTVGAAPTVAGLEQAIDVVTYGSESADTFVATVMGQLAGVAPTGSVTVLDLATMAPVCTATLVANPDDSSTATCSPDDSAFVAGTFLTSVVALYEGDADFTGSQSGPPQGFAVTDPGSSGSDTTADGSTARLRATRGGDDSTQNVRTPHRAGEPHSHRPDQLTRTAAWTVQGDFMGRASS
jgi:hypothetical protein